MCYSAMIEASVRELALRYQARVDVSAFERLFEARDKNSKIKLPKGFGSFVDSLSPDRAAKARALMESIHTRQKTEWSAELVTQEERLARAQERGSVRETQSILNEIRIAANKVRQLRVRLEELEGSPSEGERIFPGVFAPLIVLQDGVRWVRPFRYQLRPAGEPEAFDRKFNGTYNIRRDRLNEVKWWRGLFGKHHGILVMRRFYEHVQGPDGGSIVLEFQEEVEKDLLVPCLFDRNEEGDEPLDSFGLITDEPNPEVLAAGHDRTPVVIRPESIQAWLDTRSVDSTGRFDGILARKQATLFLSRRIDTLGRS
jgi:putative SOS response-associated peptidase YedK